MLNINLRGTLLTLTAFLPLLLSTEPSPTVSPDGERGVLVLVSSAAAFEGQRGQAVYAASKGAIASLALPLARDLGRWGVRAVAVAPGVFESGMTAVMSDKVKRSLADAREFPRRDGKGHEFAAAVRQVLENPMWNGAVLRLDGAVRLPSKM